MTWETYEIVRRGGENDGERVFFFSAPTIEYAHTLARDWADTHGEAFGDLTVQLVAVVSKNETSVVERLRRTSTPIPGRPGFRRDGQGREWYSDCFLGLPELDDAPSAA